MSWSRCQRNAYRSRRRIVFFIYGISSAKHLVAERGGLVMCEIGLGMLLLVVCNTYGAGNMDFFAGIFVSYLRWDGGLYALE